MKIFPDLYRDKQLFISSIPNIIGFFIGLTLAYIYNWTIKDILWGVWISSFFIMNITTSILLIYGIFIEFKKIKVSFLNIFILIISMTFMFFSYNFIYLFFIAGIEEFYPRSVNVALNFIKGGVFNSLLEIYYIFIDYIDFILISIIIYYQIFIDIVKSSGFEREQKIDKIFHNIFDTQIKQGLVIFLVLIFFNIFEIIEFLGFWFFIIVYFVYFFPFYEVKKIHQQYKKI